jgi:predicted transcriptional regulator
MRVNDTGRSSGVGLRIPHADRRALDRIASERGVGISVVLREAIRRYLDGETSRGHQS